MFENIFYIKNKNILIYYALNLNREHKFHLARLSSLRVY